VFWEENTHLWYKLVIYLNYLRGRAVVEAVGHRYFTAEAQV
jgi:hypothetical protein